MSHRFSLPTEQQVFGTPNRDGKLEGRLSVMEKHISAKVTDLAVLLGGSAATDPDNPTDRTPLAFYWTSSQDNDGRIRIGHATNPIFHASPTDTYPGVRPILFDPPDIAADEKGVVHYGEYPQTLAKAEVSEKIEEAYKQKALLKTEKTYKLRRVDSARPLQFNFNRRDEGAKDELAEYCYAGKRYIRLAPAEAEPVNAHTLAAIGLSKEEISSRSETNPKTGAVKITGVNWLEVQPIEWLPDSSGVLVAKASLIAGIKFENVQKYLDQNFAREMIPSTRFEEKNLTRQEKLQQLGIVGVEQGFSKRSDALFRVEEIKKTEHNQGGVTLRLLNENDSAQMKLLEKQLNNALQGYYEASGCLVTTIDAIPGMNAGLHISDAALNELYKLGVKMDLTRPPIARSRGGPG